MYLMPRSMSFVSCQCVNVNRITPTVFALRWLSTADCALQEEQRWIIGEVTNIVVSMFTYTTEGYGYWVVMLMLCWRMRILRLNIYGAVLSMDQLFPWLYLEPWGSSCSSDFVRPNSIGCLYSSFSKPYIPALLLQHWLFFAAKQCSGGRVYQECGSPCPRTCRNRNQQMTCASRCLDGCFCPAGTVLDGDVCVAEDQCSCVHNGVSYVSGDVRSTACEEW